MSTAQQIIDSVKANPYLKVSELARQHHTSRCQVRRVLKRENLYEGLKRSPYISILTPEYKDVEEVEFVIADPHIPHHDEKALGVALGYGKSLKPSRLRILGDFVDFHSISYWEKKKDIDQLLEEIENARDALYQLKETFGEVIFHKGNHEERWYRHVAEGKLGDLDGSNLEEVLFLDKFGIDYVDALDQHEMYGEWPKQGKIYFLHGDEARVSFNGVNVANTMLQRVKDNVIFGHFHKTQSFYHHKPMTEDVMGAWSVGCLCNLNPAFKPINDWNHGCAVIYYNTDGTFRVENKKIIGGRVL